MNSHPRSYQSVLILKPDFDEPHVDEALEKIDGFLEKHGGSRVKTERWGKKRLAYRIKKNRFGYYLNIYHTCDSSKVSSLESNYRLYDAILKYLIIKLDEKEMGRVLAGQEKAEETPAAAESAPAATAESDNGKKPSPEDAKETA